MKRTESRVPLDLPGKEFAERKIRAAEHLFVAIAAEYLKYQELDAEALITRLDSIGDWVSQKYHPDRNLLDELKRQCRASAAQKPLAVLEANRSASTKPHGGESPSPEACAAGTNQGGMTLGLGQAPDSRLILKLSRSNQRRIAQRYRQILKSLRKFEAIPEFCRIVATMRSEVNTLQEAMPQAQSVDLEWRANFALTALDIRANAFLHMVSTLDMQNALIVMLGEFGRVAWQEYIGNPLPPGAIQPEGSRSEHVYQTIWKRTHYWVTKGYECVACTKDAQISDVKPESSLEAAEGAGHDGDLQAVQIPSSRCESETLSEKYLNQLQSIAVSQVNEAHVRARNQRTSEAQQTPIHARTDAPLHFQTSTDLSSKVTETIATQGVQRKRGRPPIREELKQKALAVEGTKARAQILYACQYPTNQQKKNVSSILKYYEKTKAGLSAKSS
jgi:hypothetical protein